MFFRIRMFITKNQAAVQSCGSLVMFDCSVYLYAARKLFSRDCAGRACVFAGTAVYAGICINFILAVALADRIYRALAYACSAAYTLI